MGAKKLMKYIENYVLNKLTIPPRSTLIERYILKHYIVAVTRFETIFGGKTKTKIFSFEVKQ